MQHSQNTTAAAKEMMDAANVAGTTVLMCTVVLALVFFTVLLWRARSRYSEYMLGVTIAPAATPPDEQQQQRYRVVTLYPAMPLGTATTAATSATATAAGMMIADAADELEDELKKEPEKQKEDDVVSDTEETVQIHETK